ncbi:hypothetical protein BH20ACI2_BH20ACI2_13880 [soil metagenome]
MLVQRYVLLFAAATVTFLIGWSVFTGYRYVGSLFFPASIELPSAASTILAAGAFSTAEFSDVAPDVTEELNLTGEYYIFEETLPKGFHDFDYLEISTHEYVPDDEAVQWIPVPPKGSLQTKRNHKFTSVSVSPDFVTFETESKMGMHYRFIGKYHPYENEEVSNTIRGTLTKLQNGRVITHSQ